MEVARMRDFYGFLGSPSLGLLSHFDKQTTEQMDGQNCEDKAVFYSLSEQQIHKDSAQR